MAQCTASVGHTGSQLGEWVQEVGQAAVAKRAQPCVNPRLRAHRFLLLSLAPSQFLKFFKKPVGGHRWEVGSYEREEDGIGEQYKEGPPVQARPRAPRWCHHSTLLRLAPPPPPGPLAVAQHPEVSPATQTYSKPSMQGSTGNLRCSMHKETLNIFKSPSFVVAVVLLCLVAF